MKKQDKIDLIASGIGNEQLVRMYFKYDENYWYFYPNAVSERLMLGQEENDFQRTVIKSEGSPIWSRRRSRMIFVPKSISGKGLSMEYMPLK